DARRDRGGAPAAPLRDRAPARSGEGADLQRAPGGGRPAVRRGGREDHAQDAHRCRSAAPDRRGARRDRLHAAGGEPLIAAPERIYARALYEAAEEKGKLEVVRTELGDLAAYIAEVPELEAVLENPETESRVKGDVLEDVLGSTDELVRNFIRVVVEK